MSSLPLEARPSRASGAVAIPRADALARIGRVAVGIAFVAFGAANVVVGDFVAGRAPPWPSDVPGQFAWAYATAIVFIVAGVCVMSGRWAMRAAMVVAGLIATWALLRQIPLALADQQFGGEWTKLGKALTLSGGLLGVAGSFALASTEATDDEIHRAWMMRAAGRLSLGAFLVASGVQHFLFAPFVATLVPAWIPGAMFWTYFAGTALIAGGLGLVLAETSRLAATLVGLMVLTWLFVLHIPRGLAMNNQNEWTAVIEALAVSGIALSLVQRARVAWAGTQ
ncbi:MAG TPA: hypothetical protein VKA54_16370 [Gemmatimonadaceae bacterium]|nr:hypothetical protein [Gemmatimonadaceae bacterium]